MAAAKKEKRRVLTINVTLQVSYPEGSDFDAMKAFDLIQSEYPNFSKSFIEKSGGKYHNDNVKLKFSR